MTTFELPWTVPKVICKDGVHIYAKEPPIQAHIYLDNYLVAPLDSIVYNIRNDWDFMILITGNRMVGTGKSTLGITIGAYLAQRLGTPFDNSNIYFDNIRMMRDARTKPRFTVNIYDEGREGLAASKALTGMQLNLLDFFNECRQLNQVWIVILPDFFVLKEDIAVARSEFLLNVERIDENKMVDMYKDGIMRPVTHFHRGKWSFYNRAKKDMLWNLAKKKGIKSYKLIQPNAYGAFSGTYPIDEVLYRSQKREALARRDSLGESKAKITRIEKKYVELCRILGHAKVEALAKCINRNEEYFSHDYHRTATLLGDPSVSEVDEKEAETLQKD